MRSPGQSPTILPNGARDGRDMRWEAHRAKRRRQLVEAALKAIRKHGAGVGMDEIAATAGTSKTVLYRHLGDRSGLYHAVVASVDETILADLAAARESGEDVVSRIAAMVSSYLRMVERDPAIYRFVMTRPLETTEGDASDPIRQITGHVGEQLTQVLHEHLFATGRAAQADVVAPVWGHGIVGLVRSAADQWLTRTQHSTGTPAPTVDEVTRAVVALIRPALSDPAQGDPSPGTPPASAAAHPAPPHTTPQTGTADRSRTPSKGR